MLLLSFITLFITFLLVIYVLSTPLGRYRRLGDQIPGPKTYPFIGNAHWIFQHNKVWNGITTLIDQFGKVSRIWLGKQLFVFLSDPQDIKFFLTSYKYIEKAHPYKLLDSWLGKGLTSLGGDVWRTHRKLLTPAFHSNKLLKDSFYITLHHTNELIRNLEVYLKSNEPIKIQSFIERFSLAVVYESAMRSNLKTQASVDLNYLKILKSLTDCSIKRVYSPWLYPEFIFSLSSTGREYYRNLDISKRMINEVIDDRRKFLSTIQDESNSNDEQDIGIDQRKFRSFIDILLSENNFTDREIHDEVQTFMFAGQDTTMAALVFCIYLLSKHPDIQRKIVEENKSVVKDDNLTYEDLPKLKYLEKVIKESMRVYPTAPFIGRQINEDVTLPSGITLPAGTSVILSLLSLHHNKDNFPNPKTFDPERFNEDVYREPYSYVPFSDGIRNCMGQRFAMMEMKTFLSKLLLEYEILNADVHNGPLTLIFRISLCTEEHIMIKIRKRVI